MKILFPFIIVLYFSTSVNQNALKQSPSAVQFENHQQSPCFFSLNPNFSATTTNFTTIINWDFGTPLSSTNLASPKSRIEIREYKSSQFCIDQTTGPLYGSYSFNIPNVIENPIGTLSVTVNEDYFKKCFEWRIFTYSKYKDEDGNFGYCENYTEWQYHSTL